MLFNANVGDALSSNPAVFGTPTTLSSASNIIASLYQSDGLRVLKLSDTSYVFTWQQSSTDISLQAVTLNVDDTLTLGTVVSVTKVSSNHGYSVDVVSSSKIVILYYTSDTAATLAVYNISGTTVTLDGSTSPSSVASLSTYGIGAVCMFSETRGVLLYNSSATTSLAARGFTVGGGSVTLTGSVTSLGIGYANTEKSQVKVKKISSTKAVVVAHGAGTSEFYSVVLTDGGSTVTVGSAVQQFYTSQGSSSYNHSAMILLSDLMLYLGTAYSEASPFILSSISGDTLTAKHYGSYITCPYYVSDIIEGIHSADEYLFWLVANIVSGGVPRQGLVQMAVNRSTLQVRYGYPVAISGSRTSAVLPQGGLCAVSSNKLLVGYTTHSPRYPTAVVVSV